ncbi:BAG family molecular chaperone regulator 1-like [Magnolia sinica]|uniref:BAG family molecular chaperone regulator 1-like n=1 Tax=Magnolia sinica TaxID=86752 RepID=UPI0026595C82|nr:BAG family molecular chaperone regulator 1-like [Magnolia sinica]
MMRMKMKTGRTPMNGIYETGSSGPEPVDWELRPGGMLVQKRNPDSERESVPAPTIKVRVKYGSSLHEINISSQATFGELKKLLAAPTGLHHLDQKLLFKDKERDSTAYLDMAGVKDRSKIVLVEDPTSQERRYIEMRRNAKMERASKSILEISLEVDKLASQVSALESVISKGGKVAENDVLNLIEQLMTQLIKLDGIMVDGDAKMQRRMQVKRVQKYVETLDLIKIKNGMSAGGGGGNSRQMAQRNSPSPAVVVTTKWETFDPVGPTPSTSKNSNPKFDWEFFE